MRIDRFITLRCARPLRMLGRNRFRAADWEFHTSQCVLPILMYHSISDDPEAGVRPYYRLCTNPARFAEHMALLRSHGCRGVTLSEGLAWLNGSPTPGATVQRSQDSTIRLRSHSGCGTPNSAFRTPDFGALPSVFRPRSSNQPVAITFDDGFRDFYTAAFPILQQHGFMATMYLPTAYIGDDRRSFKGRSCLSWAEVRELHAAGIEFGSHTVTHRRLDTLTWPEIESELRESRATIEQGLDAQASLFAHPYAFPQENGGYVARLAELLRTSGYTAAVTTRIGRARLGVSLFTLKRLPVNGLDDGRLLAAKLAGAYDWLGTVQRLRRLCALRNHE